MKRSTTLILASLLASLLTFETLKARSSASANECSGCYSNIEGGGSGMQNVFCEGLPESRVLISALAFDGTCDWTVAGDAPTPPFEFSCEPGQDCKFQVHREWDNVDGGADFGVTLGGQTYWREEPGGSNSGSSDTILPVACDGHWDAHIAAHCPGHVPDVQASVGLGCSNCFGSQPPF